MKDALRSVLPHAFHTTDHSHALLDFWFAGEGAVVVQPFHVLYVLGENLQIAVLHIVFAARVHVHDLVDWLHLVEAQH